METCDRCEAPLDEDLDWCPRCFFPAPWASDAAERRRNEAASWPDIWDQDVDRDDDEDPSSDEASEAGGGVQFWPLPRVLGTVALLLALAAVTVVLVPGETIGMTSLIGFGMVALAVLGQAWRGEPG